MADSTPRGTAVQLAGSTADPDAVVFPASVAVNGVHHAAGVRLDVIAHAVTQRLGSVAECLTLNGGHRWKAKWPAVYVDLTIEN